MGEYFLIKTGGRNEMIDIKMIKDPKTLKPLTSDLGWEIFKNLSKPECPMDLAKKLGVHEQKIYYYINKFRKFGMIKEVRFEQRHGTTARYYQVSDYAFALKLENAPKKKVEFISPIYTSLLEPFIKNNEINFTIIVGSPDPHGPFKARASDSTCAIDLALFLGSFTKSHGLPNYKLDTEVREKDLKNNLILVGGPIANMITKKINNNLPIYIDIKKDRDIVSKISNRVYTEDECGIIDIIENPWNKNKKIIVLAGKRFSGTRACVLAFIKNLEKIMEGNKFNRKIIARVIKGYDMNGDGIIDSVEIIE